MELSMIVAVSENGVIGRGGDLAWHLSADLKRFKRLTMGHHIIMGRKTFESIGKCLPGRTTVIVTRQKGFQFAGAVVVHDFAAALRIVADDERPFVVGGAQIYDLALPACRRVFLTRILQEIDGDVFFPINEIRPPLWKRVELDGPHFCEKENLNYQFENYERND